MEPTFRIVPADSGATLERRTDDVWKVRFRLPNPWPGDPWRWEIAPVPGTPLVRVAATLRLDARRVLPAGEPRFGLSGDVQRLSNAVGQGPMSLYGPPNFGAGMPAGYLWQDGHETAMLLDVGAMDWFGRSSLRRFLDGRVVAESGLLAMVFFGGGERWIDQGEVTFAAWIFDAPRSDFPSRLDAVARLVEIFAPCHPGPKPRTTPPDLRWERLAERAIEGLMAPGKTVFERPRGWKDAPHALVDPVASMAIHPDRLGSVGGDFSTVNNHLTPWLLHARLNPERTRARDLAVRKLHALPAFYDTGAGFVCWSPDGHGPLAMSWQTLWFHVECLRAADAAPDDAFDPAVAGRVLMATKGLRDLARRFDDNWPQWWDVAKRAPAVQNDEPDLGIVHEPWQVGQYAYILLRCAEIAREPALVAEAARALDAVLRLKYGVENRRYRITYANPADLPVAELFGNAYGAVAAWMLYERTKQLRWKTLSMQLLATLLRLTPWGEDRTTPIARSLSRLGLFYPHGGAYNLTPWETVDANLCLAWLLARLPPSPVRSLLARLADANRVNSLDFFPAAWSPEVRAHAGPIEPGQEVFPVEPFYTLEAPGGHTGKPALYKPTALWNAWLYEALARCDDPTWMALNLASLDGYTAAIEGVSRRILVHNGGKAKARAVVTLRRLPAGEYVVDGQRQRVGADGELRLPLTLSPGEDRTVTVQAADPDAARRLARRLVERDALAARYRRLQETPHVPDAEIERFRRDVIRLRTQTAGR